MAVSLNACAPAAPARSAPLFPWRRGKDSCQAGHVPLPHATGAVDCYLHAVEHLYTMCRQVKSIEIIEFGYEQAEQGVNGAKSEYCVDKHKSSMARPYRRRERATSKGHRRPRGLQELWLKSLAELKWIPGESDEQYKVRVAKPYEIFSERAVAVRAVMPTDVDKAAAPAADKGKKSKPAKPPPKTKSAT
jgi:hypothetical protein